MTEEILHLTDTSMFGEPAGYTDDGVPLHRICDIAAHIGVDPQMLSAAILAHLCGLPIDAFLDLPESQRQLQ